MDPALWNELLRLNGGNAEMAMRMLLELQAVQGRAEEEELGPRPRPPAPAPTGPVQPTGRASAEYVRPRLPAASGRVPPVGRASPEYIPPRSGGGGGGPLPPDPSPPLRGPTALPPGPFPPTAPYDELNRALGGYDMHRRLIGNVNDRLTSPPGRLVGEERMPLPAGSPGGPGGPNGRETPIVLPRPAVAGYDPLSSIVATPPTAPVVAASTPPTVSSSGGGGEIIGPPMPRPNQRQMDGGLWAMLRAAFAGNAGNNERLALERMIASRGGGDRG